MPNPLPAAFSIYIPTLRPQQKPLLHRQFRLQPQPIIVTSHHRRAPSPTATTKTPPSPKTPDPRGINGTAPFYIALIAAQSLPFFFPHSGIAGDITYFTTTAVAALIIGCRRAPLEAATLSAPISKLQAISAPFIASTFLFGSYLLLRYTQINVNLVFNVLTTFAGTVCLKEALDPVFHSLLELFDLQDKLVYTQSTSKLDAASSDTSQPPVEVTLATALATLSALATTTAYLTHVPPTFVFSNILALGICARVLSLVRPDSFLVAAGLLGGLFFYDIFWVFGSEVMVSVATQIDSPAKLLFPRDVADIAQEAGKYPYAILGLGDVCIPGVFVTIAQAMDQGLVGDGDSPYFFAAVGAYGVGLLTCFVANLTTHAAQPALLYLVPMLILSSLGMGSARGELWEVIGFRVEEERKGGGRGVGEE